MLARLLLVLAFCAASSHALVVGTAAAASTARTPAITMNDPFRKLGNVPAPALAATVGGAGLVVAAALVSSTKGPPDALPFAVFALALLKVGETLLTED